MFDDSYPPSSRTDNPSGDPNSRSSSPAGPQQEVEVEREVERGEEGEGEGEGDGEPRLSRPAALLALAAITAVVAACSELLTGSLESFSSSLGVSRAFLGIIVLPIAGNACEHMTAVMVAMRNKMDLALGVAVGSSIQIALFAVPLAVVAGWATGRDLSLSFDPFAVIALTLSVLHTNLVVADAQSHWLMGVQLLATYAVVAVVYVFR
jgi:Ca2+:H+ antiporter